MLGTEALSQRVPLSSVCWYLMPRFDSQIYKNMRFLGRNYYIFVFGKRGVLGSALPFKKKIGIVIKRDCMDRVFKLETKHVSH